MPPRPILILPISGWHVTYACRDGDVLRGYMVKGDIFKIEEFGLGA